MDEVIDYMKEVSDAAPKTPLLFYHNPKRSNVTREYVISDVMKRSEKIMKSFFMFGSTNWKIFGKSR